MQPNKTLTDLADTLQKEGSRATGFHVVAGFDGFVDEMISVVEQRIGLDSWTPVRDITTFGDWVKAASGRSSLREIVVHRTDPGGCAVNLGDGLVHLGVPLDCFATLGRPRHAAFEDFAKRCRSCHSWGREPGRTLAFEFADGKLMFSAVTQLAEFDERLLDKELRDGHYQEACRQANLIALTDWTLYPHMTRCWRKLQTDVFSQLAHRPFFFIDLVDPTSRAEADIRGMADVLAGFEASGPTVLGLNGNEANVLSRCLNLEKASDQPESVCHQARALQQRLGISQVVIHCLSFSVCAERGETISQPGPFCRNPKKSTGAGDRFNAGYCLGQLLNQKAADRLLLGNACSGFFVRQARSSSIIELSEFLRCWASNSLDA